MNRSRTTQALLLTPPHRVVVPVLVGSGCQQPMGALSRVWGGSGLHQPIPFGLVAKEIMPTEFCFVEQYLDLTGNSLGWCRAIICVGEACI